METISSPRQKALRINLDPKFFGTIAEIGAGQEVARRFFTAGGSSGTIAKTISAYDMVLSNSLYGETNSKRYVSEERLKKMLKIEYKQLVNSLQNIKRGNTCFFAFANTISAINFQKTNESHGWIGIKFQLNGGYEANDILLHVKLYEKDNLLQQRTIGILGVNLIYAAFYFNNYPNSFLRSLMDFLSRDQLEIDMIRMSGPDLDFIDNRLISLQLVKNKMTHATVFDKDHNVRPPSDIFYKKNIMVLRGSFRPITLVGLDMLKKGFELFKLENNCEEDNTLLFCEISLENLLTEDDFDEKDFLNRVDLLNGLGINVIISDMKQHHEFVSYFDIYKIYKIGIIIGSTTYNNLFKNEYYTNLSGGLLQGFGRLFKNNVKMFVYPTLIEEKDELLSSENLVLNDEAKSIHQYLVKTGKIINIHNFDKNILYIFPRKVIELIKQENKKWEEMVPDFVAKTIKEKYMFDYKKTN